MFNGLISCTVFGTEGDVLTLNVSSNIDSDCLNELRVLSLANYEQFEL